MAKDLDPATRAFLEETHRAPGIDRISIPTDAPAVVAAGLPGLQLYNDRWIEPNVNGYVFTPNEKDMEVQLAKVHRQTPAVFLNPKAANPNQTATHETNHLLAMRQLGKASEINTMFDKLVDDPKQGRALRDQFVQDASKAYPYLQEKYGLDSGYFTPEMVAYQAKFGKAPNLVFEMLADLASIEATTGTDLTKDPYLRKNLFKDKEVREVYNALTNLRQTRLDAKDLPPHTRQKEADVGIFDRIKEAVLPKRFNKGGLVDKPLPGGKKLI